MRKILFMLLAVLAVGACSEDTTAPTGDALLLDDAALLAYGYNAADMAEPGGHFIARLKMLPDSLKLSATQESQIRALIAAFIEATKADIAALNAIHQEARAAHAAGQSAEEIRAILARGDAIRARLHEADARLRSDIEALLTAEQKAWLAGHQYPCRGLRLSDEQKTQISALIAAFQTANQADIEQIKAVFEDAREAHQSGATREQIREILKQAQPAMERVRAAHIALEQAIRAVMTPEQLRSGCFRGGMPGPGPHRGR